jgi:hypothetical protein
MSVRLQCERLIDQSSKALKKCDSAEEQSTYLCKRSRAFARWAWLELLLFLAYLSLVLFFVMTRNLCMVQTEQVSSSNPSSTVRKATAVRLRPLPPCSSCSE